LILPVVICLSQRLSHACLSINSCTMKLQTAHYNSDKLIDFRVFNLLDNRSKSGLIHRSDGWLATEAQRLLALLPIPSGLVVKPNNIADRGFIFDKSTVSLPYQLSMVRYWPTMVVTGNGELGFDSGEGAWEMATTSTEGSRRANYSIPIRGSSDNKYQYLSLTEGNWNEHKLKLLINTIGGQVWCQQPR